MVNNITESRSVKLEINWVKYKKIVILVKKKNRAEQSTFIIFAIVKLVKQEQHLIKQQLNFN